MGRRIPQGRRRVDRRSRRKARDGMLNSICVKCGRKSGSGQCFALNQPKPICLPCFGRPDAPDDTPTEAEYRFLRSVAEAKVELSIVDNQVWIRKLLARIDELEAENGRLRKRREELKKRLNPFMEVTVNPDGTSTVRYPECSGCAESKERTKKAELRLQKITAEISIRVDHGAESNGHLEALQSFLERKDY